MVQRALNRRLKDLCIHDIWERSSSHYLTILKVGEVLYSLECFVQGAIA